LTASSISICASSISSFMYAPAQRSAAPWLVISKAIG
jgi:hypothetical protein